MTISAERSTGPGHEILVRCPADGRVVGSVGSMAPAGVAAVAQELREAQVGWEAIGPEARGRWIGRWRDWILDNSGRLLTLVQQESGKSWGDTTIELQACTEVMNYYAANASSFLEERRPHPHNATAALKRLRLTFRPFPLVGVISPWNYPLAMPMFDIPAALMAGCAVLSKPSEYTPLAWTEAVRGWRDEVGAPNVLACANGGGETGAAVIAQVDMIQFTGSVATGRRVAAGAAERLIPCCLELGGNDAMLVLADADLERAVNGAIWGATFNAGQSCVAVERIYVEEPIYPAFLQRLVEEVGRLRQGVDRPDEHAADFGATATEAQLSLIERHVEDSIAKGARVLTGGRRAGKGLFFAPTVLADVDHSMACMQEETFGPILPVMAVGDAHEAVRWANDSRHGLSASVWTRDRRKAMEIADQLDVGAVNINDVMTNVFQLAAPQGGWGDSGIGSRFGGADGLLKYCRKKVIVSGRVAPKREIHWYPRSAAKDRIQVWAGRFLGARDWRRRLGRLPR